MQRTLIKELGSKSGKTVRICGWIGTIRVQKRMQFLVVRDYTGSAQIIHEKSAKCRTDCGYRKPNLRKRRRDYWQGHSEPGG